MRHFGLVSVGQKIQWMLFTSCFLNPGKHKLRECVFRVRHSQHSRRVWPSLMCLCLSINGIGVNGYVVLPIIYKVTGKPTMIYSVLTVYARVLVSTSSTPPLTGEPRGCDSSWLILRVSFLSSGVYYRFLIVITSW